MAGDFEFSGYVDVALRLTSVSDEPGTGLLRAVNDFVTSCRNYDSDRKTATGAGFHNRSQPSYRQSLGILKEV